MDAWRRFLSGDDLNWDWLGSALRAYDLPDYTSVTLTQILEKAGHRDG